MIQITDKTVFNTGAQALVNTINTMGKMGAGIALEFALRYPDMNEDYVSKCEMKLLKPGKVDYYEEEDGTVIVNFPTKAHFAHPSRMIWIEEGLQNFVDTYKEHDIQSVAFPKLGCSNGGLQWNEVLPLMEKYLSDLDIDVYICEATKREAEGKEAIMVSDYNAYLKGKLQKEIKLSDKKIERLLLNGPIKHFYELNGIEEIKGAPYKKLFEAFYPRDSMQLSLF